MSGIPHRFQIKMIPPAQALMANLNGACRGWRQKEVEINHEMSRESMLLLSKSMDHHCLYNLSKASFKGGWDPCCIPDPY